MLKKLTLGSVMFMMHCFSFGQSSMLLAPINDEASVAEVSVDSITVKKKTVLSPEELYRLEFQRSIDQFLSTNDKWYLFSVEIDDTRLNQNLDNKEDILIEAIGTYAHGLIYVESESKVLLTSRNDIYATLIYGQKKTITDNQLEVQDMGNCSTCIKEKRLHRENQVDSLAIIMKDPNPERADVFYILTFKK